MSIERRLTTRDFNDKYPSVVKNKKFIHDQKNRTIGLKLANKIQEIKSKKPSINKQ